uniref:Uncharacterized protein n=1 Tax=Vespula pensylvanica TaxID=30213 RepID=A0A834PF22_VESPE|nr:hypothetical protein H0235_001082 [Vespula pensylvanica]
MLEDFEGILNRLVSDARDLNSILLWAISMPELYIGAVRRQTEEEIFLETLSILDLVLLEDVNLPTYVKEKENFTIDLTFVNSGVYDEWASQKHGWKVNIVNEDMFHMTTENAKK